jgi:Cu-processing system permease protein
VVDGALAASRFLSGTTHSREIRPVDVALRPLFEGLSYLVFYLGSFFGVVACADFAPTLLAPGRIEHLLSLPVRRAELVLGTFVGVLTLVLAGAMYGAAGLSLIIWAKAGFFDWGPIAAAAALAVAISLFDRKDF